MKYILSCFLFIILISSQTLIDSYYNEIKRLEDQTGEHADNIYIEELHRFYKLFENSKYEPDIVHRIATQYFKTKDYDLAVIYYLKLIIVYEYEKQFSKKQLDDIIFNTKKDHYELVSSFISQQLENLEKQRNLDREYYFLKTVSAFSGGHMISHVRNEIERYFKHLDKKKHPSEAYILLANTYQKEKNVQQAIVHYQHFLKIFPTASSVPFALMQIANLYRNELAESYNAYKFYSQLVENYRYYKESHKAQYIVGEIFEKDLDKKDQAIQEYQRYVDYYPKEKLAVKTLYKISELYISLGKYDEGILALRRIVDEYRDDLEAKNALLKIVDIYDSNLDKKELAVDEMVNYAIYFPKDPKSVELLYEAVNILVNKLNMRIKAESVAQILKDKYSGHKYSIEVDQLLSVN